jgi:hypothetical protein
VSFISLTVTVKHVVGGRNKQVLPQCICHWCNIQFDNMGSVIFFECSWRCWREEKGVFDLEMAETNACLVVCEKCERTTFQEKTKCLTAEKAATVLCQKWSGKFLSMKVFWKRRPIAANCLVCVFAKWHLCVSEASVKIQYVYFILNSLSFPSYRSPPPDILIDIISVFTSLLYYYGSGTRNIENIISSVGIKATIGRIFILLRKFNRDAAEVFSGSSKVRNT